MAKSSKKKSAGSKSSTPSRKVSAKPSAASSKKTASSKKPAAKPVAVKPAPRTPGAPKKLPAKAARSTPGQMVAPGSNGNRIASRSERPANLPPPPFAAGEFVLSDGKPKKNQAGLSMKELEHFRDLLLTKRRELVGDMSSMEREALRSTSGSNLSNLPIHMADMGTDNYEQEFTLGLVQKDRDVLREINLALAKIQNGSYGICEGTGKPIGKPRLEAKPWARYGIEYARTLESRTFRR